MPSRLRTPARPLINRKIYGEDLQVSRGDVERALREANVRLDATYITPTEHPCAMEPHAAIASWSNGALTVYNSTQWVMGDAGVARRRP